MANTKTITLPVVLYIARAMFAADLDECLPSLSLDGAVRALAKRISVDYKTLYTGAAGRGAWRVHYVSTGGRVGEIVEFTLDAEDDPFQGIDPAELVVGPAGQTLEQAAAAELATKTEKE